MFETNIPCVAGRRTHWIKRSTNNLLEQLYPRNVGHGFCAQNASNLGCDRKPRPDLPWTPQSLWFPLVALQTLQAQSFRPTKISSKGQHKGSKLESTTNKSKTSRKLFRPIISVAIPAQSDHPLIVAWRWGWSWGSPYTSKEWLSRHQTKQSNLVNPHNLIQRNTSPMRHMMQGSFIDIWCKVFGPLGFNAIASHVFLHCWRVAQFVLASQKCTAWQETATGMNLLKTF